MNLKPYSRMVNYYETDQMGIVHHSNYLRYFEEARLDAMRQLSISTQELENLGIIIPNVDAYARYIRPLRYEECFIILVNVALFTGVKMKFEYQVLKDGVLCATGYTTHCFVDRDIKLINLKHTHPEVFQHLSDILGREAKES